MAQEQFFEQTGYKIAEIFAKKQTHPPPSHLLLLAGQGGPSPAWEGTLTGVEVRSEIKGRHCENLIL